MNKKTNKIIIGIVALMFLTTFSFLKAADTKQIYPTPSEETSKETLTKPSQFDSGKLKKNSGDFTYESDGGEKMLIKRFNRSGEPVFIDPETNEEITENKDLTLTADFNSSLKSYESESKKFSELLIEKGRVLREIEKYKRNDEVVPNELNTKLSDLQNQIKTQRETVNERSKTLKAKRKSLLQNNGVNLNTHEECFLKKSNLLGKSQSAIQKSFLTEDENDSKETKSSIALYNKSFSEDPDKANIQNIIESDTSGGEDPAINTVRRMYALSEDMEALIRSKTQLNTIKCFASRQLIPSFQCPLPDNSMIYNTETVDDPAGRLKTPAAEIKMICEKDCRYHPECISESVMENNSQSFTKIQEIFPANNSYNVDPEGHVSTSLTLPVSQNIRVDKISFEVEILPSASFTGDSKAFEKEILSEGFKNIKIPIDVKTKNAKGILSTIFSRYDIRPSRRLFEKSFSIRKTAKEVLIYVHDPIIPESITGLVENEDGTARVLGDKPFRKFIGSIKLKNFKLKYASNKLFFCPARQAVQHVSQNASYENKLEYCETGKILELSSGGIPISICLDSSHMIGPDEETGGFYDEESCKNSCFEQKECEPYYPNVSSMSPSSIYKVDIDCVKSKDNAGCTKELCESLFRDEKRPINETIFQGDETQIDTISNGVFTGKMRPKIDYSRETGSFSPDKYREASIMSMKDPAYNYMLKNGTYNMIKYPIGTPSPENQAYALDIIDKKKKLSVIIKPNSKDINSGRNVYLYSVIKFSQSYSPIAYTSITDTGYIQSRNKPLFRDLSYMIKEGPSNWKIFRKVFKSMVGNRITKKVCEDQVTLTNCEDVTTTEWSNFYNPEEKNGFYDSRDDTFSAYDIHQPAPYYKSIKIYKDAPILKEVITSDLNKDVGTVSGSLIRDQKKAGSSITFRRIFKGDFNQTTRGYMGQTTVYNIYSDHPLSYKNILDEIKKEKDGRSRWAIWDLVNQSQYPTTIKSDSKFPNNIKLFQFGPIDKISIQTDITPDPTEEQSKAFMFLFIKKEETKKDTNGS